ncbi:Tetraspanin/Peripherin [Heracleum sosnowskyi]|uniref:Tetraspanin/Peripherin n=1 Tax=Heracleum sosnowskyi TaxID=360622 RepID=A0AAD8N2X3_9APIA|nr:Tetraspanin/Peripherin [Heracleum sosnowskyi]
MAMADNTNHTETVPEAEPEPEPKPEPEPEPEPTPPSKKEEAAEITTSASSEKGSSDKPKNSMKPVEHILNLAAFLLSLPIIALVVWLIFMPGYDCEYLLKMHKIYAGIIAMLVVLGVLNIVASFMMKKPPLRMPALIIITIPAIVVLIVGIGLVGGFKMESRSMPGSPQRLKLKVYNIDNWSRIKSCLYDKSICQGLESGTSVIKSYDYPTKNESPVQSGCCRPPASCGMEYVNATYWKRNDGSEDTAKGHNSDCDTWTNQETNLCYNCNSCREGFRTTVGKKWIILGSFLISVAGLIFVVHLFLFLISMSETESHGK